MEANSVKSKDPILDFETLRKEGIRYIQELAGNLWTDYNLHDPGVTVLETLCYALTDLGYRSHHSMPDLLISDPSLAQPLQYTAAEILPVNPVTFSDLRKLLIDHEVLRNAWVQQVTNSGSPNGLYAVTIQFSKLWDALEKKSSFVPSGRTKDLNDNMIPWSASLDYEGTNLNIILEIAFPYWDEVDPLWNTALNITNVDAADPQQLFYNNQYPSLDYSSLLSIFLDANGSASIEDMPVTVEVTAKDFDLHDYQDEDGEYDEDFVSAVADKVLEVLSQIPDYSTDEISALVRAFNQKMIFTHLQADDISRYLARYRTIGQDLYQLQAMREQPIAVMADVALDFNADPNNIWAELMLAINQYLTPEIPFYTLAQMMEDGFSTDEIFEGPLLQHGFIKDEDLDEPLHVDNDGSSLVIYTSDIIEVMMRVEGVVGVSNLSIQNFIKNEPVIPQGTTNCLSLTQTDVYKPVVSISKSVLHFTKENYSVDVTIQQAIDIYLGKQEANQVVKVKRVYDLPLPEGEDQSIESYSSIQKEFPAVYGIGTDTLSETAAPDRKAKVKQLQAYLFFFDQLLANYLAQLAHLGSLLSANPTVSRTCYYQTLYDIPGAQDLLKAYKDGNASWEEFMADPQNNYVQTLAEGTQTDESFLLQRNQFLDHLMARFAERFTDYTVFMFDKETNNSNLIRDKSNFLLNYPNISGNRAKGYNYLDQIVINNEEENSPILIPNVWNTNNVSGFQQRIGALLGIIDTRRRNLVNLTVVSFDGNQENYIEVEDPFENNTAFTIEAWVNPSKLNHEGDIVGGYINIDEDDFIQKPLLACFKSNNGIYYSIFHSDGSGVIKYGSIDNFFEDVDIWVHIAWSYDGENMCFYRNGELFHSVNVPGNYPFYRDDTHSYFIGSRGKGEESFCGSIAEVRIWNYARNHITIARDLNKSLTGDETGLTAYWNFDTEAGTATDLSPYAHNGVLTGDLRFTNNSANRNSVDEGFYLVEHILLRPTDANSEMELSASGFADPYSFQLSFIFPDWPQRFNDQRFRIFAEKLIQREAPAHIKPYVYWIGKEDAEAFQVCYRNWLELKTNPDADITDAREDIINLLNGFYASAQS